MCSFDVSYLNFVFLTKRLALKDTTITQKRIDVLFRFVISAVATVRLFSNAVLAQSTPEQLQPILAQEIQASAVVEFELRQYLSGKVPKLVVPGSSAQWKAEAERTRRHLLEDVIFHGWPREWVTSRPNIEDLGLIPIPAGRGYRMRKIRYEIVPGFQSTAILYEPESLSGRVPAILNVNGHVGPVGKAAEYKQKRCISFAKGGVMALNVEWMGCGELSEPENGHDFGAHLDLVGTSGVGLFYLAMRKGLDYIYDHPNVDRSRIGMTGLSGGGWQTIVLSAIDARVAVSVPVAGFGSLESNIVHPQDTSEIEEDATDLRAGQDYTQLTAMRAPRPTLLIYNAEDDCCFRASMVKPTVYEAIRPFFRLFNAEDDVFRWHENLDPSTHNYQRDNRAQAYAFFTKHFRLREPITESASADEILTREELTVGLPKNNQTILGLARKLADEVRRFPVPAESQRIRLKGVVRYRPITVQQAWLVDNTKNKGVESHSYRLGFSDGLSATGVWMKATDSLASAPITILLHDNGKKDLKEEASERINRGEQVLALDILFSGDASPRKPSPADYSLLLASVGDRPIGIEAAQLVASVEWLRNTSGAKRARLEATGMRSQVAALISAALEPELFSQVIVRQGLRSLRYLLDLPVKYRTAADLFCLDLYKEFDIELLASLAAPTRIRQTYIESTP